MDNKNIAHEWFRYAAQDLSSANYLRGMRPVPLEISYEKKAHHMLRLLLSLFLGLF